MILWHWEQRATLSSMNKGAKKGLSEEVDICFE